MESKNRFQVAARAAALHLSICSVIAIFLAWLILEFWYPGQFRSISGGSRLLIIIIAIDVVLGPLLTLVAVSPQKRRRELRRDLSVIVGAQFAALIYGVWVAANSRPVILGFEGDRIRVVAASEINRDEPILPGQIKLLRRGPQFVGVRLLNPNDAGYKESVISALQGNHPSFRPTRWVPIESQRRALQVALQPMSNLAQKNPSYMSEALPRSAEDRRHSTNLAYLPVVGALRGDWVALLDRSTDEIVDFLPLDGW